MTSGRRIARNVLWNLLGQGAPLVLAVVAAPLLIHGLGTDRFGILTLAWVLMGYFSLFDLGLGRALTQMVAQKLGEHREAEVEPVVWTALTLMLVLGVVGAVAIVLVAPWLVHDGLKIPARFQRESLSGFYLLAFGVPIVITSTGLRGLLEALQLFGLSNAVRLFLGAFTYLGPLMVLPFSRNLFFVLLALVLVRLVAWVVYILVCTRVVPGLGRQVSFRGVMVVPLLRFGGWMTVSNLVSPLMVYLDRFVIGAVLSVTAVAYYATPNDTVTKLWVIPAALAGVLFPAFATSFAQDRKRTALLFTRGVKYLFLILFPITLLIVTLAHEGISVWLGSDFARHSARVLQWLAAGVFVNSLAQIAFAAVQGAGRPDLTAKLNLVELPFYLAALWWLLRVAGIEGAAIAWTARLLIDMVILFVMALRLLPSNTQAIRTSGLSFVGALIVLAAGAVLNGPAEKILFLAVVLAGFFLVSWFRILSPEERALGRAGLRLPRG